MNKTTSYEVLYRSLKHLVGLTDDDWNLLKPHLVPRSYKKHEHLLETDQASGYFWFVAQGLIRNYYLTSAGKEFNKSFIPAPDFCGSIREMVQDLPSRFSIQALEESHTLAVPIPWYREIIQTHATFARLARLQIENLAIRKEDREEELLLDDATTRYLKFCQEYPTLEARIPAYHIASYLGITEVALSRLKAKLKTKEPVAAAKD